MSLLSHPSCTLIAPWLQVRQLRLKWHPDKHDVLKEMAEEVTKIINETVEKHEQAAAAKAKASAELAVD